MHSLFRNPEIIIFPVLFGALCFLAWTFATTSQQRFRLKSIIEFNSRLIDRLGSINDFAQFAQSEVGIRFINSIVTETPKVRPGERILRATQVGIVLIMLSLGFLGLANYLGDQEGFVVVGVVSLSLGAGFLISAVVSHRVSVALGLHDAPTTGEPLRRAA